MQTSGQAANRDAIKGAAPFIPLRKHERTGRPLRNRKFVSLLEKKRGKLLTPQKGGRPKKQKNQSGVPGFSQ